MRVILGETRNLGELCIKLNRVHEWCAERGMSMDELDMPTLPTFGGEEPDDDRALSWDEDEVLVKDWDGSFMLALRDDLPCVECGPHRPVGRWSQFTA